ncbi:hypothetical protein AAFF_G00211140 [Aldrovandia affinis]|uniref:Uncharacterized protein n=1 Tax=Aldrovandia affinis TaxID=143900 RepID=A0AAD7SXF1_9TELE|nr:hypothetical protein AAFF_G00211140 [Aldrovandia affinis]
MNMAENQDEETPREERASSSSPVDTDHSGTWVNREAGGQLQGLSQEQTAETEGQTPSVYEHAVMDCFVSLTLIFSPGHSPGLHKPSECKSPAFIFSMNTTPETPAFSGFGCSFNLGSLQDEVRN